MQLQTNLRIFNISFPRKKSSMGEVDKIKEKLTCVIRYLTNIIKVYL